MRTISLLAAIFCLFLMSTLPQTALSKVQKERLCVLDLDATHGVEQSLAEALSMIVRDEIHSHGDYVVMSREDLAAVASREQLLQAMGCADESNCLMDFGRAIGSRFMVVGAISKIGSTYIVNLRMLDTKGENAGLVNRVSQQCKCSEDDLIGAVQVVAARLIGEDFKVERAEKSTLEAEVTTAEAESQNNEAKRQGLAAENEARKKQKAQGQLQVSTKVPPSSYEKPGRAQATEAAAGYTDRHTGMEFVLVNGGCYQMGDTFSAGDSDEKPVHEVCVGDFFMGKYEVTQGEWQIVMGSTPSTFPKGSNYPVEKVSWHDTQKFLGKLNSRSEKSYRLPTEAEWEYAARSGGKELKYGTSTGQLTRQLANYGTEQCCAGDISDGYENTSPVGSYPPNGLGLYDMSGNVWEWCSDWYDADYYGNSPRDNPGGPTSGVLRVNRGGCWGNDPGSVRAARRYWDSPEGAFNCLGFRLVLPIQ